VPSEIVGTGALWLVLTAALAIVVVRKLDAGQLARAAPWTLAVLAIQSLHFAEEFATGFHERFPALLGLAEWTPEFFVCFNMAWIAAWAVAIAAAMVRRAIFLAAWLVWFLALAATANGVVHPVLAIASGGYFPGLLTSPVLGVAGIVLIRALTRRSAAP
jgi:hypothetical protein